MTPPDTPVPAGRSASFEEAACEVVLREASVPLYRILKFEGLVASGAEAKQRIAEGLVRVNGAVETRKRRQIRAGDRIEFENSVLLAICG